LGVNKTSREKRDDLSKAVVTARDDVAGRDDVAEAARNSEAAPRSGSPRLRRRAPTTHLAHRVVTSRTAPARSLRTSYIEL
jgi:hypothetical protein